MMELDKTSCSTIIGPLIILTTAVNLFFVFCILCPPASREVIKQPLKLLLWSLISSALTFGLSMIAFLLSKDGMVTYMMALYAFCTSITTSAWLNFFFCTQIIPTQQNVLIWIKKNIKAIIFYIWICDRIYWTCQVPVILISTSEKDRPSNITFMTTSSSSSATRAIIMASFMFAMFYFLLCLCVMMLSSSATAFYLCGHIRRMAQNGAALSCPTLRSQVRVTFTGILQGVMQLVCSTLISVRWFKHHFDPEGITCTPFVYITIFMFNTTLSLWVGQAVFRRRTDTMWLRAARWCKTCKVQLCEDGR